MKLRQTAGTCRTVAAGIQTDRLIAVRGGCAGKDQCHLNSVLRGHSGRTKAWHLFHCGMWLAKLITWFTFTLLVWEKLCNPARVTCMFKTPNVAGAGSYPGVCKPFFIVKSAASQWDYLPKHLLKKKKEEFMGRRGRRGKQQLDDLEEKRVHWKLKNEALDRSLQRTCWWKG